MKLISSKNYNNNIAIRIIFLLFAILFTLFLSICIYTTVIYPHQVSSSIRKDIIKLYAPIAINEEDDAVLLTLTDMPNDDLQTIIYE